MSISDIGAAADIVRLNTSTRQDVANALEAVEGELEDFIKDMDGIFVGGLISTSSNANQVINDTKVSVDVSAGDYVYLSGYLYVSNGTGNANMRVGLTQNGSLVASNTYELFHSDTSGAGGPALIQFLVKNPPAGTVEYALGWLSVGGVTTIYSALRALNVIVFKRA